MAITLDFNFKGNAMTLSDGNLSVSQSSGFYNFVRATEGKQSGKWYWEFKYSRGSRVSVGIVSDNIERKCADTSGYFYTSYYMSTTGLPEGTGVGYCGWASSVKDRGSLIWTKDIQDRVTQTPNYYESCGYGSMWGSNDTIGIALDFDRHQITYYVNGVSQGVAIKNLPDKKYFAGIAIDSSFGGESAATINFGANSFKYPIPEGFKAYDLPPSQRLYLKSNAAYGMQA